MKNIWTIARMTFRETIRKRVVLTGATLGEAFFIAFTVGFRVIYINLNKDLPSVAIVEITNTLLLAGLYGVAFLSIAMGALLGADTLAGEIASGTIQTLVSKPARRLEVVLGKWLGFAILLFFYSLLMSGGTILSVWLQSRYAPPNVLKGLSLIYLESLLIMTISLFCSSFLSGLASGGTVFGLWGLAFIGGWVEQIGATVKNETAVQVGVVISLIIPSEALWRRASFEMQSPVSAAGMGISPFATISVPSLLMVAYAGIYLILVLLYAVSVFQRRDL